MSEQPSTGTIKRIAEVVRKSDEESTRTGSRRPSPPPDFAPHDVPCPVHGLRIERLEKQTELHDEILRLHESALHEGRTEFAVTRKDLQVATAALTDLAQRVSAMIASRPAALEKIQDALIHWGVPLVGGGILWAVVQSKVHP